MKANCMYKKFMLGSLLLIAYSCQAMQSKKDEYISHNNIPKLSLLAAARFQSMVFCDDLPEHLKKHVYQAKEVVVTESYNILHTFLQAFMRLATNNHYLFINIQNDKKEILSKAIESRRINVIQICKQLMSSKERYDFLNGCIQNNAYSNCKIIRGVLSDTLIDYKDKIYGWPLLCGVTSLRDPLALECVSILLRNGADPNAQQDLNGDTALMCASHNRELLELLLRHGADQNLTNDAGDTLLAKVIRKDDAKGREIFKFLIKKGISINATIDNESLLGYAKKHCLDEIGRILRIKKRVERSNNN